MKTVIGNWKMNVGVRESVALARGTLLALRGRKVAPEVVICPSFVALSDVHKVVARSSVALGAQNVCGEEQGAFTGEISARMLSELGVTHVLIGHSERRHLFGETDEVVNKKLLQAFAHGLIPVLCIGETQQEYEQGKTRDRVQSQMVAALSGVRLKNRDRLFVAYEPVWAIGSGKTPEVAEIVSAHALIRGLFSEIFPLADPGSLSVLYGGSVDGKNAYPFLREAEVDGVLVGGASVKLNQFKDIIVSAGDVLEAQASSV